MSELLETLWTDAAGEAIIHGCTKPWPNDIKWVRADLPPTLSAAMELPEVKALVDAATALLVQVDGLIPIKHPQQKLERNKLRHAITALAAIKETKT